MQPTPLPDTRLPEAALAAIGRTRSKDRRKAPPGKPTEEPAPPRVGLCHGCGHERWLHDLYWFDHGHGAHPCRAMTRKGKPQGEAPAQVCACKGYRDKPGNAP